LEVGQVQTLILSDSLDIETIQRLRTIADQYDTEALMIGKDEDFGKMFTSTVKIGWILRYNKGIRHEDYDGNGQENLFF
jgi:hypothetical protein